MRDEMLPQWQNGELPEITDEREHGHARIVRPPSKLRGRIIGHVWTRVVG